MKDDLSLDQLLRIGAADALVILNARSNHAAELLEALEQRLAAAMAGFDHRNRKQVDRLTALLMEVTNPARLETRIRMLGDSCFYYIQTGRPFDGIPRGLAARKLAESCGLKNLARLAGNALGTAYADSACFEEACRTLERTLELARELGDPLLECLAISNAAGLLKEMGLYQDAIETVDKALSFDLDSPRGRYLALCNALHGLFSAHRLRDDQAALRFLKIGSEVLDDNPLANVVLKINFEYFRAMYLLFKQDNETAELLIAAARARCVDLTNPRVAIMLDLATALCDWASREPEREARSRKQLLDLYHRSKETRLYHDDVLRGLMDVHSRTMTGETDRIGRGDNPGDGVDALKRIVTETARTGMRYAKELVDYTAGSDPAKELVEYTAGVKRAKFYRQVNEREASQKATHAEAERGGFDPFAGARSWLVDQAGPQLPSLVGAQSAEGRVEPMTSSNNQIRKHDELTAIHGDLARLRTDTLKAAMRTAAYDVAENWALAAEFFDDQTGQHCFRVGRLSGLLAAEIGMDAEYCIRLEHGARLHDIGKIAVNEMILLKPGPLDAGEVIAMRAHTEVGGNLLEDSTDPTLQMAARIAQYHHAWWNGTGYPNLSGERIPLEARLCALADVYDALVNERPYKRAWPHRMAVEQMMAESGVHFDPGLMRPFLKVLERHVGSTAEPPSTQLHLQDMEANGLLSSRRKLMKALMQG